MKINEITQGINRYMATVRVVTFNGTATARTVIDSDTQLNARMLLVRIYGRGNVISVQQITHEDVTEETKTLSPSELQARSLADQAQKLNQQATLKKAQSGLAKAQDKMRKISSSAN